MDTVAIVLSTYNGEKYLEDQLDSIIKQSYQDWRLYIRDDGSSDETKLIIERYSQLDSRISFLKNEINLGVIKSFLYLLTKASANYYMFCDQDDIWLEDKISNTLAFMKEKENQVIKPYVIHTDLQVVDENLNIIAPSRFELQDIPKTQSSYMSSFIRNNVTGCTVMINHQLKKLIIESDKIIMHDWWIALIGLSLGEVCFLPTADILYRQHGGNTLGAKKYSRLTFLINRLNKLKEIIKGSSVDNYSLTRDLFHQAGAFVSIYEDKLTQQQNQKIKSILDLIKVSKFNRLKILITSGITMGKPLLTLNFYIAVLLIKKEPD